MPQIDLSLEYLDPNDVVANVAEHNGSGAVRLVLAETLDNPTFARIKGLEFQNSTEGFFENLKIG
ncbi:MAG: hypothetical protein HON14_17470 [Rhodospirillaceae bacterium]|jgi:hypothetical protein|nr:hypothetical protein [Rhodospirillaceae bacterium]MBT4940933.1 hypothetical protein [Rhodospirillaceae bacterium]MBT7265438.1 hypothetical protein [Rhodospirillaceae bacterium]